nr:unnamed protein product [Callosobruchus analis]
MGHSNILFILISTVLFQKVGHVCFYLDLCSEHSCDSFVPMEDQLGVFFDILGLAVRCYQCGSSEDGPNEDNCGAYRKFDTESHIAVDCSSEESHMPGDGRWRQVIRRCASIAENGVTGVCNWGVYENGIYWEECYCSEDECNSASAISVSKIVVMSLLSLLFIRVM